MAHTAESAGLHVYRTLYAAAQAALAADPRATYRDVRAACGLVKAVFSREHDGERQQASGRAKA